MALEQPREQEDRPLSLAERIKLFDGNANTTPSNAQHRPSISSSHSTSSAHSDSSQSKRFDVTVTAMVRGGGGSQTTGSIGKGRAEDGDEGGARAESPSSIRSFKSATSQPDVWKVDVPTPTSPPRPTPATILPSVDLIQLSSPAIPVNTRPTKPPAPLAARPSWHVQPPTPNPSSLTSSISSLKLGGVSPPPTTLVQTTSPPRLPPRRSTTQQSTSSHSTPSRSSSTNSTTSSLAPALPPRPSRQPAQPNSPPFFHQSSSRNERRFASFDPISVSPGQFTYSHTTPVASGSTTDFRRSPSTPSFPSQKPLALLSTRPVSTSASFYAPGENPPPQFQSSSSRWAASRTVDPNARARYETLFVSLLPSSRETNGTKPAWIKADASKELLSGEVVKPVWERSKLSKQVLCNIWYVEHIFARQFRPLTISTKGKL